MTSIEPRRRRNYFINDDNLPTTNAKLTMQEVELFY